MLVGGLGRRVPPFTLEWVARRLAQHHATVMPEPSINGAVLAPLTSDEEPTLLFTRRAARVANFPGEVSFPGGGREAVDASLLETALRETHEEIGVPSAFVDVVGRLDDHHVYGERRIRTFVGVLSKAAKPVPDPREVERIFTVPLRELARPQVWEGRVLKGAEGGHVVHYFRVAGETVWGATGRLVADLLGITRGWRPPARAREVSGWQEFRQDL